MAEIESKDDPFPLDRDLKSRHDWFAKRLENKSREDSILLAARATLRALPRAKILNSKSSKLQFITTIRFNIIAILESIASAKQSAALWGAAAAASVTYVSSYPADISASTYVTTSAFIAVNLASSSPESTATAAAEAINYATAASDTDNAVIAFQADLWQLDGTISAREHLAVSMLWPRGGMPNKSGSDWREFMDALVTLGGDWEVWTQWYYGGSELSGKTFPGVLQGAREGKYLFGLPTARALKLWHDVALIDDALWKGDPAALNAEFKRLVDEARADVNSPRALATPGKTEPVQYKAKISIGKAVVEKQGNLLLMIELALSAIQAEIEAQEKERPNSEEAIARRDQILVILRSMQEKHLALKNAVIDFPAGNISESKLVEVESEFWKPFRSFWSEKGSGLIENLTSVSLFLGGVGIATAIGAPALASTVTIGVITGGKPVVEGLKAVFAPKSEG